MWTVPDPTNGVITKYQVTYFPTRWRKYLNMSTALMYQNGLCMIVHIYISIVPVFMSLQCSRSTEKQTLTTDGNNTELVISNLTPFTNYTVFVEGSTVDIGDKSVEEMVVTLQDGNRKKRYP